MCGLFGLSTSNFVQNDMDLLLSMSILSSLRGVDSAGICAVSKEKNDRYKTTVIKGKYLAPQLLLSETVGKHFRKHLDSTVTVMGHARAATIGSITPNNAHPFRCKHIIGTHNGTIPSIKNGDKTDSETLFNMIADRGLEATLPSIQSGAFALVWINETDKTINFYRNTLRPLYFAEHNGNLLWMSEDWMFDRIKTYTKVYPRMVPAHQLITVPLGVAHISPSRPVVLPAAERTTRVTVRIGTQYPNEYPYVAVNQSSKSTQDGTPSKLISGYKVNGVSCVVSLARKLLNEGCINCGSTPSIKENVFWTSDTKMTTSDSAFVCEPCFRDDRKLHLLNIIPSQLVKGGPEYVN